MSVANIINKFFTRNYIDQATFIDKSRKLSENVREKSQTAHLDFHFNT